MASRKHHGDNDRPSDYDSDSESETFFPVPKKKRTVPKTVEDKNNNEKTGAGIRVVPAMNNRIGNRTSPLFALNLDSGRYDNRWTPTKLIVSKESKPKRPFRITKSGSERPAEDFLSRYASTNAESPEEEKVASRKTESPDNSPDNSCSRHTEGPHDCNDSSCPWYVDRSSPLSQPEHYSKTSSPYSDLTDDAVEDEHVPLSDRKKPAKPYTELKVVKLVNNVSNTVKEDIEVVKILDPRSWKLSRGEFEVDKVPEEIIPFDEGSSHPCLQNECWWTCAS